MLYINGFDNAAVNQCMSAVLDCISSVSDCQETRLYHYTSTAVLDSLLSNATFWASNIYYLNDASEFQTGIEALKKHLVQVLAMKKMSWKNVERFVRSVLIILKNGMGILGREFFLSLFL